MLPNNFSRVVENDKDYHDVCTASTRNKRESNVFTDMSATLQCPGEKLDEWDTHAANYKSRFTKARKCLQRRLTTMKRFSANTPENRNTRKRHVYPIQVAYTLGRNCLRKVGTRKNVKQFTNSTANLVRRVSEVQPNVKDLMGTNLNTNILARGDRLSDIVGRIYYDNNQWAAINTERNRGYNKMTNAERSHYNTLFPAYTHVRGNIVMPETHAALMMPATATATTTNTKPKRHDTRKRTQTFFHTNSSNSSKEINDFLKEHPVNAEQLKIITKSANEQDVRDMLVITINQLNMFKIENQLTAFEDLMDKQLKMIRKYLMPVEIIIHNLNSELYASVDAFEKKLTNKYNDVVSDYEKLQESMSKDAFSMERFQKLHPKLTDLFFLTGNRNKEFFRRSMKRANKSGITEYLNNVVTQEEYDETTACMTALNKLIEDTSKIETDILNMTNKFGEIAKLHKMIEVRGYKRVDASELSTKFLDKLNSHVNEMPQLLKKLMDLIDKYFLQSESVFYDTLDLLNNRAFLLFL